LRRCADLEREYTWPATDEVLLRHATVASGSVILAACAVEATVNEYHLDSPDRNAPALGRAAAVAHLIEELWDTVDRLPILRKYQWILSLAHAELFDHGQEPFQAAADLVELRDALVHYKPEWSHAAERSAKLEKRLGHKFELNRLSMPGQFFLPYRCLGFGCAKWAVRVVQRFVADFASRLGVEPVLARFSPEIDGYLSTHAV
jgi:hypothetical protein